MVIEKGYKVSDPVGLLISNKQHYLFQAASKAPRYKDLLCSNYIRIYEENNPCQFEAMTFSFDDNVLSPIGRASMFILPPVASTNSERAFKCPPAPWS